MRIAVIGLGKLGCPMAALLAAAGNDVTGADLNPACVELVNQGRAPVLEPGLDELMVVAGGRLRATTSVEESVADAEIAFCIVPTPSLPDSSFDTSYAEAAFEAIGRGWRAGEGGRRVAVLTSTVLPGATEARVKPALERGIGREVGDDLGLCYSPEFIALGTVIENMRHPDMILMGASAEWAAQTAISAIRSIADHEVPVAAMSIVDAEVTKIAINTFITTKISYANMIGEVCEQLPGADASVVTAALGLDTRIGRKYIQPAAPYGGPCIPPWALLQAEHGLRRAADIVPGERVLAHDGHYRTVEEVFVTPYSGDLVRVTATGFAGQPIEATPDHPVLAVRRTGTRFYETKVRRARQSRLRERGRLGEPCFVPIGELERGDLVLFPRDGRPSRPPPTFRLRTHHLSKVRADNVLDSEMAWLFGLYLAEGSIWRKEVKLSLHEREVETAERASKILAARFGTTPAWRHVHGKAWSVRCSCSALADFLRATFGAGAERTVPTEWLLAPTDVLSALVAGMWEGDGSASGDRFAWASISRDLFNFMKLALLRLGIPFVSHVSPPRPGHREAYFVKICPAGVEAMNALGTSRQVGVPATVRHTTILRDSDYLCPIRHIERVPFQGLVYNFEVADAHSYAVEGGVLHNCFPRDNAAFAGLARSLGLEADIAVATDAVNRRQVPRLISRIRAQVPEGSRIAVLGLSYKPSTPVVEESFGLLVANELAAAGYDVAAYDPAGDVYAKAVLAPGVKLAASPAEAAHGARVLVVATPWPEFAEIERLPGLQAMFDYWRIVPRSALDPSTTVMYPGTGSRPAGPLA
jgi:nucleotide sugar dehydrogenase